MNPKYNKLNTQIEKWVNEGEYQKILDTLLDIPRNEFDAEMIGLLARTYNSLGQYQKAIPLLLSIEMKSQKDANWFFRMGTAYYYTKQYAEATEMFQKVLELEPEDIDAHEFIFRCLPSFRGRVIMFWKWFDANEEKLTELIQEEPNPNKFVEFLAEGLLLLDQDNGIELNTSNPFQVNLLIKSKDERFYLYPYFIEQMPEKYKNKWTFLIGHQPIRIEKMELVFEDGKKRQFSSIKVKAVFHPEERIFHVIYLADMLRQIPRGEPRNHLFWTLMDLCIGEECGYLNISSIDQTEVEEEDMIPLTQLKDFMVNTLKENGMKLKKTVRDIQFRYRNTPSEDDDFTNLRYDIREGCMDYPMLLRDYYHNEIDRFCSLMNWGVKAAFLAIPYKADTDLEYQKVLSHCRELKHFIQTHLLDDSDAHPGKGIVLGEAIGDECMYIDLLLFDELTFIRDLKGFVEPYPYNIILSDFRQGAWYTLIKEYDNSPRYRKFLNRCVLRTDI